MQSPSADAGTLGEPSYVWRSGQERRLSLIREHVRLENRRVLDVGCGIGTYVRRLRELTPSVCGVDVSTERLRSGGKTVPNLIAAAGEQLPFRPESFDVILLNEVIEHVRDDRATIEECIRVLGAGGHLVIFAPNRLYPFETHGIYLGQRYIFGNIPLVNYLPNSVRNRLVPHARAYRTKQLRQLVSGMNVRLLVHTFVYPGFDNVAERSGAAAKVLRAALYRAEHTTARCLGLSHFLILQKNGQAG
jgi:SAM-dependent methyltransferase